MNASVVRLKARFARIPKVTRALVRAELRNQAEKLVAAIKAATPVDEGDLKKSIGFTFGKYTPANANVRGVKGGRRAGQSNTDPDLSVTIHAGDAKAFYAAFVEFGTAPHFVNKGGGNKSVQRRLARTGGGIKHPGAKPKPYFFPTYRARKKAIQAAISKAMRQGVEKAEA